MVLKSNFRPHSDPVSGCIRAGLQFTGLAPFLTSALGPAFGHIVFFVQTLGEKSKWYICLPAISQLHLQRYFVISQICAFYPENVCVWLK